MLKPGLRAAQRLAQQVEQPDRILADQIRDVGRRHREQLAAGGDGAPIPSGVRRCSAASSDAVAQQQQLAVGEPVRSRACDRRRRHRRARSRARCAGAPTHAVDLVAVLGDRVALRRGEDDVELIEAAEAREERAEGWMTRLSRGSSDRTSASKDRRRMPSSEISSAATTAAATIRRRRCAHATTAETRACTHLCYIHRPPHARALARCASRRASARRRKRPRLERGVRHDLVERHRLGVAVRERHPHGVEQQRRSRRPTDPAGRASRGSASVSGIIVRWSVPGRSLVPCSSISNCARRSAAVPLTKYFCTRPCAVADVGDLPDVVARPRHRHLVAVDRRSRAAPARCSAGPRVTGVRPRGGRARRAAASAARKCWSR